MLLTIHAPGQPDWHHLTQGAESAHYHVTPLPLATLHCYPSAPQTLAFLLEPKSPHTLPPEAQLTQQGPNSRRYTSETPYLSASLMAQALLRSLDHLAQDHLGTYKIHIYNAIWSPDIPLQPITQTLAAQKGIQAHFVPTREHFGDWHIDAHTPWHTLITHLAALITLPDPDKFTFLGHQYIQTVLEPLRPLWEQAGLADTIQALLDRQAQRLYTAAFKNLAQDHDPEHRWDDQVHTENTLAQELGLLQAEQDSILPLLNETTYTAVTDFLIDHGPVPLTLIQHTQTQSINLVHPSLRVLHQVMHRLNAARLTAAQASKIALLPGTPRFQDNRFLGTQLALWRHALSHTPLEEMESTLHSLLAYYQPQTLLINTYNAPFWQASGLRPPAQIWDADHLHTWLTAQLKKFPAYTATLQATPSPQQPEIQLLTAILKRSDTPSA